MGALYGAPSYRQQHDNLRHDDCIDVEAVDVTTDPEEGRRQVEAMQPPALKVGDRVRLKAGGERVMAVVDLADYGNNAVCGWAEVVAEEWAEGGGRVSTKSMRDTFPVSSLVRVELEK